MKGKLGRDYVLYGTATAARQLISFAMLPFYTRVLTPEDYGAVEIITLITTSVALLLTVNLGEPIFRFASAARTPAEKAQVLYTALALATILNAVASIAVCIGSPLLAGFFMSGQEQWWPLLAMNSIALITEGASAIAFTQMRTDGNATRFFVYSLVRMTLQLAANVVLVLILKLGAQGVVLSHVLSSALLSILVIPATITRPGASFSRAVAGRMLRFGVPLTISAVIGFYASATDRLFLGAAATLAVIGTYALATRLSQVVVTLIYEPFEQAWDPEKYRLWSATGDPAPIQSVFRVMSFGVLISATAIAAFAAEIFRVVAGPQFWDAAEYAPSLLAAAVCSILTRFCRFGSLLGDRVGNVTASAAIAGTLLTALLALLVPVFGAMGAAWAVLASSAVRLLLEELLAKRTVNLHLPWSSVGLMSLVCIAGFVIVSSLETGGPIGFAQKSLLFIALAASLWLSPLIAPNDRALLQRLVRRTG